MHIGLCSPIWPPEQAANGIVSYVAAVRDHFVAQGHRVSILSEGRVISSEGSEATSRLSPPRRGSVADLVDRVSHRLGSGRGHLPAIGRKVAAEVAEAQRISAFDIIEMEESFGWSDLVQRRAGVPVVTRLHGPYFLSPVRSKIGEGTRPDRDRCRAEGRAVRSARTLTAPTRAIMAATCAEYERPSTSLSAVIPNPIQVVPEASAWRLDSCDPEHILMVGRFDYAKGADTMLMAFERLLERRPGARLTLVGPDNGIELTPGQKINFDAYARASLSSRTRERVVFTGKLPPARVAELRRTANVTVIASRRENFPYALLEGFAQGCPMISTDWPGSDEIIQHGRTGLLTPVGQPNPLAEQLDFLLGHPEVASRMAAAGRRRCAEAFSVETVGNQILDCYRATLEDAGK